MANTFDARRRDVLKIGAAAGGMWALASESEATWLPSVALVADSADPVVAAAPVQWAIGELRAALEAREVQVIVAPRLSDAPEGFDRILLSGPNGAARDPLRRADVRLGQGAESLALFRTESGEAGMLVACGSDGRGLAYALTELADRVRMTGDVRAALTQATPIVESPSVPVRSIMRQFVSEPLDKGWFNDREMWTAYIGMLAQHRFNRLHLAFGLGYDSLRGVTDSYFVFLYPFVVDVPGYDVRITNFTAEERASNLAMLRFISEECVKRGVDFQLGIWTHAYALIESPNARYHVEGLTPETHAAYCRDALTTLLRELPAVSSVAIRFHGESGIAEGSYDFWQTVYDGVAACGRVVEIDLHAKGVDLEMIARAKRGGMPVNVSEKCWAEHHGMTYHQADIRPSERPRQGQVGDGLMALSEGALSFTRYGIADLMREDRDYTVRHRVFAGTQRLLMSGDPSWAPIYAERFTFCSSQGFDLMEPLTARGRRGTGIPGTLRSGYEDRTLEPRYDWEKYLYWYRVWGRLSYNRESDPSVWRRHFPEGAQGSALISALARASRILPIVSTAHMPSAACDAYWPEVYWAHSLVNEPAGNLYWDTPSPKTFPFVTAHDPQLFTSIDECAGEMLSGSLSGRYTPLEVAEWLERLAASVEADLLAAGEGATLEMRRILIDARIQAGLGRFFAAKFRAGVLFGIFERTRSRRAVDEALAQYDAARTAWAALSEAARVYAADLSVSDKYSERKHWRDQLAAIDADIAALAARRRTATNRHDPQALDAVRRALAPQGSRRRLMNHRTPQTYAPGRDVVLTFESLGPVRFFYRRVNQAERWVEAPTEVDRAVIPAAYATGAYPLQYYFVAAHEDAIDLFPGFGADLTDEPYIVLRRA